MPFELKQSRALPGIQAVFEEYEHPTGMRHVHVRRADPERAFNLMFPTPPSDDCGIPHILEHLALSGSEKFPVRDPFFSMLRRSTASFINAMTASNHTFYPFATTNENDYWNLLSVYADATFFPALNRLDFQQEGWRDTLNEKGEVEIQGVVYNEMLGALNSRDARLEIAIDKAWNSGQPTEFVSGGEPLAIPFLKHEDLVRFHHEHYHPSRAILLTYGDFDASEVQQRMEDQVLSRRQWEHLPPIAPSVPALPVQREMSVRVPQEGEGNNEHSVTFLWSLDSSSPDDHLLIYALNPLLLGDGGPINRMVENADFCRSGGIVFGHEDNRAHFRFELHGLEDKDLPRAQVLVQEAIAAAIATPITPQQIEAVLRDFEFTERDPGGKVFGFPYGVGKMYLVGKRLLENRDPFTVFDNGPALARLRERLLTPGMVSSWLTQNLARAPDLTVHGKPDPAFQADYEAALANIAAQRTASLTHDRAAQIRADMAALAERQSKEPDYDLLPGLVVSDLSRTPRTLLEPKFIPGDGNTPAQLAVEMAANGQTYLGVTLDVSRVPVEDMRWVGLLVEFSSSVGLGDIDWAQAAQWREVQAVGSGAAMSTQQTMQSREDFGMEVAFDAYGLTRDIPALAQLLRSFVYDLRVDEKERISQVIEEHVEMVSQQMSQLGNDWSSLEMMQAFSGMAKFRSDFMGRGSYAWLLGVRDRLADPSREHEVYEGLARAKEHLRSAPIVLRVADQSPHIGLEALSSLFRGHPGWHNPQGFMDMRHPRSIPVDKAFTGNTPVQYMRQAWLAPDINDPDSGNLAVLAQVLSMEFLHTAIREKGGAYGSGASYDKAGFFSMMSYRDPRLADTLKDFDAASQWPLSGAITQDMVNSAIISVCRSLDAPVPLARGAKEAWSMMRSNITQEERQRFRDQVLDATSESVMDAARRLFSVQPIVRVGFVNQARADEAAQAGFQVEPLAPTVEVEPPRGTPKMR